jgi:hypothetical protein
MEGGSVRIWDWLTGAAGLALAIGLFLPFYRSNQEDWSAWKSFMLIDKLMLITAFVAMAVPIVAALKATDKQTQRLILVVIALAALTLICVIVRMANPAEFDAFDKPVHLKTGAFLSLVATVVMLASAVLGVRTRLARRARV